MVRHSSIGKLLVVLVILFIIYCLAPQQFETIADDIFNIIEMSLQDIMNWLNE